jgi:hypothetical protein
VVRMFGLALLFMLQIVVYERRIRRTEGRELISGYEEKIADVLPVKIWVYN